MARHNRSQMGSVWLRPPCTWILRKQIRSRSDSESGVIIILDTNLCYSVQRLTLVVARPVFFGRNLSKHPTWNAYDLDYAIGLFLGFRDSDDARQSFSTKASCKRRASRCA